MDSLFPAYKGITPDKLNKYSSRIDHYHSKIEESKQKFETLDFARTNTIQLQKILKSKDPPSDAEKTQIKQNSDYISHLEQKMDKILLDLESINKKQKSSNDDYITIPVYGPNDTPDFIAIRSLPAFDPDKGNQTLYDVWQIIVAHVEDCNLSEKALRTILQFKLQGKALSMYLIIKSKPIKKIITLLNEEYGSFPTRETLEYEKENFERKENESIYGAMTRFEDITKKLYKDLPENELTEITHREAKNVLKRIVKPPEVLSELQREINRASDIGAPLTYEAMLEIAHFEEKLHAKHKAKKAQKASKPNPLKPERTVANFFFNEEDEEEIDDEPQHEIVDERPPNRYHDEDEDEQDYWAERRHYYNNNSNRQYDNI